MRLQLQIDLDVDEKAWALEYGLADGTDGPPEVARQDQALLRADILAHLPELVAELVQEKAKQMGTFALHAHRHFDVTAGGLHAGAYGEKASVRLVDRLPKPDSGPVHINTGGVVAARWGDSWRLLVPYDDGWDVTGPPATTLQNAAHQGPRVAAAHY